MLMSNPIYTFLTQCTTRESQLKILLKRKLKINSKTVEPKGERNLISLFTRASEHDQFVKLAILVHVDLDLISM